MFIHRHTDGKEYQVFCWCDTKRPSYDLTHKIIGRCSKCETFKRFDPSKPLTPIRKWMHSLSKPERVQLAINLERFQDYKPGERHTISLFAFNMIDFKSYKGDNVSCETVSKKRAVTKRCF